MPIVPSYKRDLQCYGGIYDETGTQALSSTPAQLTTGSAAYGPTAYNCLVAADFDDITVYTSGIYEIHMECNWHTAAAHTVTFAIRDDGTNITGATMDSMSVAETASCFQHVATTIIAELGAGSVIDVTVNSAADTPTITVNDYKFWLRKIAPSA